MKKKGWIGILIGIIFCLTMALPSFVHADVTVDGNVTYMVDLEAINLNGTLDPNIIQSGTTRNAFVDSSGNVATYDDAALWASVNGWSINVDTDRLVVGRSGSYYGILFNSLSDGSGTFRNGTVTNYGSIGAVSGTGIALGTGTITNYDRIIGYNTAIDFNGTGTGTAMVTNNVDSLIHSNDYNAIDIYNVGTVTVTNSGEISSNNDDAIYMYSDGALTARIQNNVGGTIDGYDDGIHFESAGAGTVEITNAGTIAGEGGNGIYIQSDGALSATITNNAGGVIRSNDDSDGYEAIYITGNEVTPAGTATVNNYGTILTYDDYGGGNAIDIQYLDTATVNNFAGGLIWSYDGNPINIYNVGTATVNNSGRIEGYWYDGIYISESGTAIVNNNTGGSIYSYNYDGIGFENVDMVTVTNAGTIDAWDGIWVDGAGTVTITNSGTISGEDRSGEDDAYGIYIANADTATIKNSGTISGYGESGYEYDGIYTTNVKTVTVTNNAGGMISGITNGIYIEDSETVKVTNSGTIQANDDNAIDIYSEGYSETSSATVTNNAGGTIKSLNNDAIAIYGMASATVTNNAGGLIQANDGYGIYIGTTDTTNVTNAGTIQSYYDGVYIDYTDVAKVTNSGMIQSYNGRGIAMDYFIGEEDTAEIINSGTIQAYGDGVYVRYADTATVTNNTGGSIQSQYGRGVALEYIGGSATAEVINSGIIQAYGPHGSNGIGDAVYIGNSESAKVTNNAGGFIQSLNGYGVGIEYSGGATVANSGLIQGYINGVGIQFADGDVLVTNNTGGTIQSINGMAGVGMQYVTGTAEVINKVGGAIQGGYFGVAIYNNDEGSTEKITNSGLIQGSFFGVGLGNADTATVINNAGGTIQQIITGPPFGYGVAIESVNTATVTNAGTIIGYNDGVGIADVGTANVTNTGVINGVVNSVGIDGADSATVTNSGLISGADFGVLMRNVSTAEVTNEAGGTISGNAFGVLIMGADERVVTNENGGTISGQVGIGTGVGGSTEIFNYGKIESTDGMSGRAIVVRGYDNQVTLGTGSEIIGNIVAVNSSSDNYMILDGEGAINANQMQGFAYLDKTGTGTWTLSGDMDYNSSYSGHGINIEEGVLAFADRNGDGGVYTNTLNVYPGASLGYVVTATGSTGALTTYDYAYFDTGSGIVVIPKVGTYAPTTTYLRVLRVDGNLSLNGSTITDPALFPSLVQVTSTSAYLKPYLIQNTAGGQLYDLGLDRLSFTTGTTPGTAPLGAALDGMYDTATGDLRTLLDQLLLLSPGEAQTALAEAGGASYPAFQFLSFNGLGKYLGVLNNHIGMGGAFAGNNQRTGMAGYRYDNGMQLAMASGGNSMNDAAPMLLAMAAGNAGQGQIAAGTNWGAWIDAYGSIGNRRSDEIMSKYKQTLFGGMLGFDIRVAENLFLGISGGLSRTDLDFDDLQDNGNMDSYHGSVYLCYNGKPWYAEGVFTYAYNKYDMERFINIGSIHEIAKGDFNGNEFNGYAEVGYKLNAGGVIIRPLAAFQIDYLKQNSFTETGSSLNLVVDSQNIGSYQSYLGVNVSGPIKLGASAVLTPELRLKWAHEFSNDDHLISARFAAAGSDYFTVAAEELSRDTAIAGLGMNLRFNKNLSAYLQYDAELNSDFVNHTGLLGLRLEW